MAGNIVKQTLVGKNVQFKDFADFKSVTRDSLVVFSELTGGYDKSQDNYTNKCGEDSFPLCAELETKDGKKLTLLLVDDGLGSGSLEHVSLLNYLHFYLGDNEEEANYDKRALALLLSRLFGKEFLFDDKFSDVRKYAERCFARTPINSNYVWEITEGKPEVKQCDKPWFRKTSSFMGARIITVAVYYFLKKYFLENEVNDLASIVNNGDLKRQLDSYIQNDIYNALKTPDKLGKILYDEEYDISLVVNKKADLHRYYLPSSFAAWVLYDSGKDEVEAMCLNIGDVRCYTVNKVDGIYQVSDDDAFPNNNMSGFVCFGSGRLINKEGPNGKYTDCIVNFKAAKFAKPCVFFVSSDGVYDTCREDYLGNHEDTGIAFEEALQKHLRTCYSMDDAYMIFGKAFYYHADDLKTNNSKYHRPLAGIKQDDSATTALKAYWTDETYTFAKLLEGENSLDRVIKGLREGKYLVFPPVKQATAEDNAALEVKREIVNQLFTIKTFVNECLARVFKRYPVANSSDTAFYGYPHEFLSCSEDTVKKIVNYNLFRRTRGGAVNDSAAISEADAVFRQGAMAILDEILEIKNDQAGALDCINEEDKIIEAIDAEVASSKITRIFYTENEINTIMDFICQNEELFKRYFDAMNNSGDDEEYKAEYAKYEAFEKVQNENGEPNRKIGRIEE